MKILALLAFTFATLIVGGLAHATTLDEGNRAFAAGQFQESSQVYETLLSDKGYSAPVLFDLGNSYYREGKLGPAILAYKRAQVLAPHDADIAANLQAARKQAGLPASEPLWTDKFSRLFSASEWSWLACAAWTLLCATLIARALVPQRRGWFTLGALADTAVLAVAIAGAYLASAALPQGVVLDKDVTVVIAPFPAAQTVFSPAPGETLAIDQTHGDFYHVTDRLGHSGWISKDRLTPIVPS